MTFRSPLLLGLALAAPLSAQQPAPQAPDFLPRAAATERATMLNRMLDTDRDGVVSRAEVDAWAAGKPMPAGMVESMFADADTNRDGGITLAEQAADALRSFDAADTDHDGRLTVAERDAAERLMAGQAPADGPLPVPTRKR